MSQPASVLIRVVDLDRSVTFYCEQLGFQVDGPVGSSAAVVSREGQPPLLLAGPGSGDLSPHLTPRYQAPAVGQRIYLDGATPAYYAELQAKQLPGLQWSEQEWGLTTLLVTDPDGYILSFETLRPMSDAELLRWYDLAPQRLDETLSGLSEADLDLARAPGKWTIRQLVLHLVDSDATSLARVKFALAEPGRTYTGNGYDPDAWAAGLDYAHRAVTAEVALFKAIRAHIGGLLRHLPGALERSTTDPGSGRQVIRPAIQALTVHALHHIGQIEETRAVHGLR